MKRLVVLIVFLMALVGWFIYSTVEAQEPTRTTTSELVVNDSSKANGFEYKE